MTEMQIAPMGVIHGNQCQCPRCQIKKPKEPEIKHTSYQTKAFTISLLDIEYRGDTWFANFKITSRLKDTGNPSYGTITADEWNVRSSK